MQSRAQRQLAKGMAQGTETTTQLFPMQVSDCQSTWGSDSTKAFTAAHLCLCFSSVSSLKPCKLHNVYKNVFLIIGISSTRSKYTLMISLRSYMKLTIVELPMLIKISNLTQHIILHKLLLQVLPTSRPLLVLSCLYWFYSIDDSHYRQSHNACVLVIMQGLHVR